METPLSEVTFVVTDTETTGIRVGEDRMIEIAAVKVRNGEIIDRFSSLVNPKQHVPNFITNLTGISTLMLVNEPTAEDVLPNYLEFLGDDVLVAHNLSFDDRIIDHELERSEMFSIENPKLCTLKLARRILPSLPSKSLKRLADHFGIRIKSHHRALGDAEATALVLIRLVQFLINEQQVTTLEELLKYQSKTYSSTKGEPKHVVAIRENILPTVPDAPGVYLMRDRQKRIIYIGKAKRLKMRVTSYFRAIEAHPKKTRDLLRYVRHVEWETLPSELDALLLESKLIKQYTPRFNRALKRYKNYPYIRLDMAHQYPSIGWTYLLKNDGASYFGPLNTRDQAEQVVEMINHLFKLRECTDHQFEQGKICLYHQINRCDAPCIEGDARKSYKSEVASVQSFLEGHNTSILALIEEKMKEAALSRQFEEAGWFRDQRKLFERILTGRKSIASPVRAHHSVLLVPLSEKLIVHLIRFGQPIRTVQLQFKQRGEGVLKESLEILEKAIHKAFNVLTPAPEVYDKEALDEIRVLAHWLYCNRGSYQQVFISPEKALQDSWEEIKGLLNKLTAV